MHRDAIKSFLTQIETTARKKFQYFDEVASLYETVLDTEMLPLFRELLFHAAAVANLQEIMKRTGPGTDGFDKLSAEFQSNAMQVSKSLKTLTQQTSSEASFTDQFLILETESFQRLTNLCIDLRILKNWENDGHSLLSHDSILQQRHEEQANASKETKYLFRYGFRSCILAAFLCLVVAFLDPPVTVFGWILLAAIVGLLMFIFILMKDMQKLMTGKNSHGFNIKK